MEMLPLIGPFHLILTHLIIRPNASSFLHISLASQRVRRFGPGPRLIDCLRAEVLLSAFILRPSLT